MADAAAAPAPTPKKAKKGGAKKGASHPKYAVMIASAITALKERGGSSRQAILKYIIANNKVDEKAAATQLKLALKRGVASGALRQVKGSGASGSFRISKPDSDEPKVPKKRGRKPGSPNKKPAAAKKAAKKPAAKKAKKPAAKKTPKKPAAKKSPKKPAAKKAAKKPAAKKAAKKPAAKKAAKK